LAGAAVDGRAFPPRASDAAFVREVERIASGAHWVLDANAQLVLFPARDAVGHIPAFCAYHGALRTSGGAVVPYAVIPYPAGAGACGSAPSLGPSGDADADRALPTILREQLDMARDPLGNGWYDAAGNEPGDLTGAIR
jgi:hypothetical protein